MSWLRMRTWQFATKVYGDDDDQYWNRRLPFRLSLDISVSDA